MNRQERLRAIAELLESQATASQREIVEMLLEQGVSVTPAHHRARPQRD